MSGTITGAAIAPDPARTGFLRRNRVPLALGGAVLALLVTVTWLNRDQAGVGGSLDPQGTGPGGARAVAQVLGDQGVEVDIVRGQAEFTRARVDAGTTVVVTNPAFLGASTWSDLDSRVRRAEAVLVVAGLSPAVADGLGLSDFDIVPADEARTVDADCDPAVPLMEDLSLTSDLASPAVRGDGCFGDSSARQLLVDRQQHRWILTNPGPVSNEEIDLRQNAAVVLRLFGQRDRVVWYVADVDDTLVSDGVGLGRLLPDWLVPALWLTGVAMVSFVLVRARRLGPLVTEPIPVTIKALESTTGLGRLYEQARDRTHAASLLVEGTARRIAPLLGLAEHAPRTELVRAAAERTGRPVAEVAALLPGPTEVADAIRTDADLVTLAQNLHRWEEEVRNR